jgi:hypothetical protein
MRSKLRTTAVVSAVVVLAAAWLLRPRHWDVSATPTSPACVVSSGMPKTVVAEQCGAASRQGGQPKVMEGLSTICSAPCELRGDLVVFYGCASTVAFVERASEARGCIFRSGAEAR